MKVAWTDGTPTKLGTDENHTQQIQADSNSFHVWHSPQWLLHITFLGLLRSRGPSCPFLTHPSHLFTLFSFFAASHKDEGKKTKPLSTPFFCRGVFHWLLEHCRIYSNSLSFLPNCWSVSHRCFCFVVQFGMLFCFCYWSLPLNLLFASFVILHFPLAFSWSFAINCWYITSVLCCI